MGLPSCYGDSRDSREVVVMGEGSGGRRRRWGGLSELVMWVIACLTRCFPNPKTCGWAEGTKPLPKPKLQIS